MRDDVWQELRQRLVDRRHMLGMPQAEVAERAGIWQSTLSQWEKPNSKAPNFQNLVKWGRALRMTVRAGLLLDCPEYKEPYFADLIPKEDETPTAPPAGPPASDPPS